MPLPLIVVELSAQDRGSRETAALIEACSEGLGGGRCTLTQTRNTEAISAIAIVSWRDTERLRVLVEVARLHEPTEVWRSEELTFQIKDQKLERFRALGLAIAALYRRASGTSNVRVTGAPGNTAPSNQPASETGGQSGLDAARAESNASGRKVKPAVAGAERSSSSEAGSAVGAAPRPAPRNAEAWISTGALASYDPKLPGGRAGAQLQAGLGATALPYFISGFGSYAVGLDSTVVSLSWVTLGLGPGLRVPLSRRLELRSVAQGIWVNIVGRASDGSQTGRESVGLPGVRFGLELMFRVSDRVGGTVSGHIQTLAGNVLLKEHDQPVGTVGRTDLGITLSLEFQLFVTASSHK